MLINKLFIFAFFNFLLVMKKNFLKYLAEKYGLPCYVYDSEKIKLQYEILKNAFNVTDLKLHFACKALSNINILRLLKSFGAGLDTVSIQEVHLGLRAGFLPCEIMYTPSGVSFEEFEAVAKMGAIVNIDNLNILEPFGNHFSDIPVCIRINPHIKAGGNDKISTGHIDSKFGISISQKDEILKIVKDKNMKIRGIHMHTGSDISDIALFCAAANVVFDFAKNFKNLEVIDLGSGFKVPYQKNEKGTNIQKLGKELSEQFGNFCKSYGKNLKLMFEPGKFLVSESGKFLTKVNIIKKTSHKIFAAVDSGFHHLARPMLYEAYHHIENISNPQGKKIIYDIVGYLCEEDTFAYNRPIAEISKGDILCFDNAGAYGYSMASNYNSRFRPAEVLLYKEKDYLIRERENMEDLLRGQIDLDIF